MDNRPQSRAPLIAAIVLLLLPMLYVGSYFALVVPKGLWGSDGRVVYYRNVIELSPWRRVTTSIFWPLEQIDRKARWGTWNPPPADPFG